MEAEDLTIEQQAEAQGWKADYNGPNAKTAEQFIEDGEKIAPIQKERNSKLVKDIARLEKKLDKFQDMHIKTIHATEKSAYDRAVLDLKKEQRNAAEEADADKVEAIQEKIDKLPKPETPKDEDKAPSITPEFIDWNAENDWYKSNKQMTAYADMLGEQYANDYDHTTPAGRKSFLKRIEKDVKKVFKDNFGEQRSNFPDVETPSSGTTSKKGKDFKSLPPEAKAAAEKFIKEGLFKDKDQYAKKFWELNK